MLSILRTLAPHVIRRRWRYGLGAIALGVRALVAASLPFAIQGAIDALAADQPQRVPQFAAWLVGLAVAKAALDDSTQRILLGAARRVERDLRIELAEKLFLLPRSFYAAESVGGLATLAIDDLAAVRRMVGEGLLRLMETLLTGGAILIVMSVVDWRLTLLVFAPVPVASFVATFYGGRIQEYSRRVQQRLGEISGVAREHFAGLRLMRAYGRGQAQQRRFLAANDAYAEEHLRLIGVWRQFYPALELLIGLSWVALLGWGAPQVLDGRLTVGQFAMYLAYLALLTSPMLGLGWALNAIEAGAASAERVREALRTPARIEDGPRTDRAMTAIRGDLEFRDVTVYRPGTMQPILDGVNIYIPAGRVVAVVGRVGSGKSTLLNLIPRLLDPSRGEVLIDGVDVRHIPLALLRSSIGYATQEAFLLSGTARENITLGRPEAEAWEIEEASGIAQLWEELQAMPEGLDTPVGERGSTVSGGQKQRIALARALLRDPRLLLLDDALSNVDLETEVEILDRLRLFLRNRTTLFVTQRVAAARMADEILVLEQGRIIESGSQEELLEKRGAYYELYQRQMIEEELTHGE